MDAGDLFRRLAAGAKFDRRRFVEDAAKFQVFPFVFFLLFNDLLAVSGRFFWHHSTLSVLCVTQQRGSTWFSQEFLSTSLFG